MPLIPFPNVPNVAGVPAVPRNGQLQAGLSILVGTATNFLINVIFNAGQWGVFDSNGRSIGGQNQFGTVLNQFGFGASVSTDSVSYAKETRVSEYIIERGGFASYNKVEMSATPSVVLNMSGSKQSLSAFLNEIDLATKSTDLYSVATPEVTYVNYNITGYNYQRKSDRGANMLSVELTLMEIRENSAAFTTINQPKEPSATPQQDTGKVQPKAPEQPMLKKMSSKFPSLGTFQ